MYVFAQLSILAAILMLALASIFGLTIGEISMGMIPLYIIYGSYCYYRLYKISVRRFALKTLLFLFLLMIGTVIFSIITIVLMAFNYGGFEAFVEAQKGAQ